VLAMTCPGQHCNLLHFESSVQFDWLRQAQACHRQYIGRRSAQHELAKYAAHSMPHACAISSNKNAC
jgi:hypothetical protein